jgi:hypothetical protein
MHASAFAPIWRTVQIVIGNKNGVNPGLVRYDLDYVESAHVLPSARAWDDGPQAPSALSLKGASSASERDNGYPFGYGFLDCLTFAEDEFKRDNEMQQCLIRIAVDLMPSPSRDEHCKQLDRAVQSGVIEVIEAVFLLQLAPQFGYTFVGVCEVNHERPGGCRGNEALTIRSKVQENRELIVLNDGT